MIKKDLDELPALECDEEEITEGNVIKMLTTNKSLTRFTLLLAQKKKLDVTLANEKSKSEK